MTSFLRLWTLKDSVLEVMNHGVCNLGVYERSPYSCFLEALSVCRYSFGGYELLRLWSWSFWWFSTSVRVPKAEEVKIFIFCWTYDSSGLHWKRRMIVVLNVNEICLRLKIYLKLIFNSRVGKLNNLSAGMRSRDIFGRLRLRLRLRLRGSIPALAPAPTPAPGKMYRLRRLRLRLRLRWSSPHMSLNQQYDFQKCQMSKYDFLLTWPWVWMPLWTSAFEICHSLSSKATGWHWRHRLLRVALSEISDLGPKWSFATDRYPAHFKHPKANQPEMTFLVSGMT